MSADIPTTEPSELRAGDTWKWTRGLDDYPASAGWTLKYRFKSAAGGFEVVASASGDSFSVTVAASATGAYAAGRYTWAAWVEGGTAEKYSVDAGTLDVLPDYRSGTATTALDDRSHARKTLDAIEAVIENRATLDQLRYTINGRELQRTPIPDLLKFRQFYKAEVRSEEMAERIRNGTGIGGRIQFRLG